MARERERIYYMFCCVVLCEMSREDPNAPKQLRKLSMRGIERERERDLTNGVVSCESVSVIEKNYANNVAIMDTTRTLRERE